MLKYLLVIPLLICHAPAYGTLAGGRLNAISEGQNAFAGVINPANAVWVEDRIDVGAFWVHQKSSLNNRDNNPFFPPGKIDLTHRCNNLFTADLAIHKQFKLMIGCKAYESSFSLATYTTPSLIKLHTKEPLALAGTTRITVEDRINAISAVFSFKPHKSHSVGIAIDYLYFTHLRNGFQNSDNPLRSVSPGNVTNRGRDHSSGVGFTIGYRWNITKDLDFGVAWANKAYCGRYRKYRGFEPHHAKNYTPQLLGAGLSYHFASKWAARLEVVWSNLGKLPNANSNILPNGSLNLNKRGSNKSPGPGLQDATYVNMGLGYKVNDRLSLGTGYSHRIRLRRKNADILAHTYTLQTIYDVLSLGADIVFKKHSLFLGLSYGFRNKVSGFMPAEVGGGRFSGEKQITSLSISYGYKY